MPTGPTNRHNVKRKSYREEAKSAEYAKAY
jgi:hypothetical protein